MLYLQNEMLNICDVLHDLVPFVQFRKCEKHPRRNVTFSTKSNTFSWCFSRYLNCTNGTKSRKASHECICVQFQSST